MSIVRRALLASVLVGCTTEPDATSPPPEPDPDPTPPALPAGVFELAGTDPTLPTDDLAALDALIGDRKLVGLGESVHASGGFYAFKLRVIQHLVQDRGFRVFALENSHTATRRLDDYVQACRGKNLRQWIYGSVFTVFTDSNFETLMNWLCTWNEEHPTDRVHMMGFDAQQPDFDYPHLRAFLEGNAPQAAPGLLAGLTTCKVRYDTLPYEHGPYETCLEGLVAVDTYLLTHRGDLVAATDERTVKMAELAALGLRSWQGEVYFGDTDLAASHTARDTAMTKIFLTLRALDFPDARVVLWAHNFHLNANHRGVDAGVSTGAITFGTGLRDAVGEEYFPIAFTGSLIEIEWPGQPTWDKLDPPSPGSLAARLAVLGKDHLVADAHSEFVGTQRSYLASPYDGIGVIPQQFDAVVYFRHSPPMEPMFP